MRKRFDFDEFQNECDRVLAEMAEYDTRKTPEQGNAQGS